MERMNNKTYDYLKWIVLTVMPALAVLVSVIGSRLGWEDTETAVVILNAVTAFLGTSLGFSSVSYHKSEEDK